MERGIEREREINREREKEFVCVYAPLCVDSFVGELKRLTKT